jgi:hypothetical protein
VAVPSTLSSAVTVYLTWAPSVLVASTTMSSGTLRVGGVVSSSEGIGGSGGIGGGSSCSCSCCTPSCTSESTFALAASCSCSCSSSCTPSWSCRPTLAASWSSVLLSCSMAASSSPNSLLSSKRLSSADESWSELEVSSIISSANEEGEEEEGVCAMLPCLLVMVKKILFLKIL